jgi:hypothetical protein
MVRFTNTGIVSNSLVVNTQMRIIILMEESLAGQKHEFYFPLF